MHACVTVGAETTALAVVLVHGLAASGRYLEPTARALAPDHRVYLPDLPGFGRSEGPRRALTVSELVEALIAWMEAEELERVALGGHSFGCQIAARLATRVPERVARLVLLAPTGDPRARSLRRGFVRFLRDVPREPLALIVMQAREYLRPGPLRIWRTARAMRRDRIEDALPRIEVAAIVIHGTQDPVSPREWAAAAARLLPRGRSVEVAGAAHGFTYTAPAAVARLIAAFLANDPGDGEIAG